MRSILRLATVIAACVPTLAQAATPCMTQAEFGSLIQYALPSAVIGAKARCAATLPANAYLITQAEAVAGRYRPGSAQAWPQAKAAFLRLSNAGADANTLLSAMPDQAMQQTVDGLIQGLVAAQLPPSRCGMVDRLVRDVAPLPARNAADLVALLVQAGTERSGGKAGPITICPA